MNSSQNEEDLIQEMLQLNIDNRNLEEEFQDFVEQQEETSQLDITDQNIQQMQDLIVQFLKSKNIPYIGRTTNNKQNAPSKKDELQLPVQTDSPVKQNEQMNPMNNNNNNNHNPLAQFNDESMLEFNPQEIKKMQVDFQGGYDDSMLADFEQLQQAHKPISSNNFAGNPPPKPLASPSPTDYFQGETPAAFNQNQSGSSHPIRSQSETMNRENTQELLNPGIQRSQTQSDNSTPSNGTAPANQLSIPERKESITLKNGAGGLDVSELVLPEFPAPIQDPFQYMNHSELSIIISPNQQEQLSRFVTGEEHIQLIEQFEKQQQDRDYLAGNSLVNCKKVELNKIGKFMKSNPTKFPSVNIQSYKVLEEGFLKGKHVVYQVRLTELDWTAFRRYSDFKLFRDILERHYPGYFIPPLPRRTLQRKFEKEYLEKRMKILEQFMVAVMESEILKNSQFFEDFLYVLDEQKYRKIATSVPSGPTELNQFMSLDGKINCKESKNFNSYGAAFRTYTTNLSDCYLKAKNATKEVTKNLEETAKSMKGLSAIFMNLNKITKEFNDANKIGLNEYLSKQYEQNSKFLDDFSEVLLKQQAIFKEHIYMKIRYEKKVCQVFEDMSERRNYLMATFQDAFAKLTAKKRKLFEKKDIKTWDLNPNIPVDATQLLKDEKHAFKYMLSKETSIVKEMSKKLNFISSNLFYETRKNLSIRESKISNDFILFTSLNGELILQLKDCHDTHLHRLQDIVKDSQIKLIQQLELEKNLIDQSVNLTFAANVAS